MKFVTLIAVFLLIIVNPFHIESAVNPSGYGPLPVCVDRIEEEKAVITLDDGTNLALPSSLFGSQLKEGDCLNMTFVMDATRKDSLEKEASNMMSDLLKEPR